MKLSILLLFVSMLTINLFSFEYISPVPNSELNLPQTNIILRSEEPVDSKTFNNNSIIVTGSISGIHSGKLELSDDNKTITFLPVIPFIINEEVTVLYNGTIAAISGKNIEELSFRFKITGNDNLQRAKDSEKFNYDGLLDGNAKTISADSLPADYPAIAVKNVSNPSPGYFFFANPAQIKNYGNFCMIFDNDGKTKSYKRTVVRGYDFKMQGNGYYSYADAVLPKGWFWANVVMYVLNENLAVIDSFKCGNGYQADMHEFKWLPNGHVFLLSQDPQSIDMSKYFIGGNPNATVAGTIIQELDSKKNVVFQWRSWDHLNFSDTYEDTLAATVNPFHFNALDIDKDGNILVSVRHACQILKISRKTGEIIWRLGGKTNQFQFIGESEPIKGAYFSHQHNIVALPNGNISLYDNGWIRSPQFSRGVEYKLDEANMTATKVWEFRHSPDIYTDLMGSVQTLKNGNRVICWGGPNPEGREMLTELHPDNSIAIEMTFPPLFTAYRIYKYELPGCQASAKVSINEVMQGNTYNFDNDSVKTGISIMLNQLSTFVYNNITVKRYECSSLYPEFNGLAPMIYNGRTEITTREIDSSSAEIHFELSQYPEVIYPEKTIVYQRTGIGSGKFVPLTTEFDQSKNELIVTSKNFGEYVLGWVDSSNLAMLPPILVYPKNKENIMKGFTDFEWSPQGMFSDFKVEFAYDPDFKDKASSLDSIKNVKQRLNVTLNDTFYWHVKSNLNNQWSEAWSFTVLPPYIAVINPVQNETIKVSKTTTKYITYWNDNFNDYIRIELYREGKFYKMLADSFKTKTNAYAWPVNDSLPEDSTYQIKFIYMADASVFGITNNFRIVHDYTVVAEAPKNNEKIELVPNPATSNINLTFDNNESGDIEIRIFDSKGNQINSINLGTQPEGTIQTSLNTVNMSTGFYFIGIITKAKTITGQFIIKK